MPEPQRDLVEGDLVRDWSLESRTAVAFPYNEEIELIDSSEISRWLWPNRTVLWNRSTFGKETYRDVGRPFFEYHQIPKDRNRTPLSIAFAFVATHNHFVLDRGGKVFNRSAPVIKLPAEATEVDHLALLGLLNSSTACFWMKQVFYPKGGDQVGQEGARIRKTWWDERYEFTGTGLQKFPIPNEKPLDLATVLDRLAQERNAHLPAQLVGTLPLSRAELNAHGAEAESRLRRMIALQEELDWCCYRLYGITEQDLCYPNPPEIALGQRAFEIVMARQMAKGELETTWFERHRSTPITEIPDHWPGNYKQLVERRIALIESDRYIGLIERPEYKRRWNQEPWEEQEQRALRDWLLDRLEQPIYWPELRLQSVRSLAERAQTDADFMAVAELYVGHPGFNVPALVAELVEDESVPFLPVLRYKPSGLRKRGVWERTWELQREEDRASKRQDAIAGDEKPDPSAPLRDKNPSPSRPIPPPPKYRSADFLTTSYWRLRGPLDVPKERFVSYPHCAREHDPSLVVGWAGWDPLQQAQALAGYYTEMVEQEGWPAERLKLLLAGLAELLPWLKQWHNDIDPTFNERMGDFFETFLRSELQKHGLTGQDLSAWGPPAPARRGRRKK